MASTSNMPETMKRNLLVSARRLSRRDQHSVRNQWLLGPVSCLSHSFFQCSCLILIVQSFQGVWNAFPKIRWTVSVVTPCMTSIRLQLKRRASSGIRSSMLSKCWSVILIRIKMQWIYEALLYQLRYCWFFGTSWCLLRWSNHSSKTI